MPGASVCHGRRRGGVLAAASCRRLVSGRIRGGLGSDLLLRVGCTKREESIRRFRYKGGGSGAAVLARLTLDVHGLGLTARGSSSLGRSTAGTDQSKNRESRVKGPSCARLLQRSSRNTPHSIQPTRDNGVRQRRGSAIGWRSLGRTNWLPQSSSPGSTHGAGIRSASADPQSKKSDPNWIFIFGHFRSILGAATSVVSRFHLVNVHSAHLLVTNPSAAPSSLSENSR
jgi:hypothetical protein